MNKTHLNVADPKVALRALKEFTAAFSYWRLGSNLVSKSVARDASDPNGVSNANT